MLPVGAGLQSIVLVGVREIDVLPVGTHNEIVASDLRQMVEQLDRSVARELMQGVMGEGAQVGVFIQEAILEGESVRGR